MKQARQPALSQLHITSNSFHSSSSTYLLSPGNWQRKLWSNFSLPTTIYFPHKHMICILTICLLMYIYLNIHNKKLEKLTSDSNRLVLKNSHVSTSFLTFKRIPHNFSKVLKIIKYKFSSFTFSITLFISSNDNYFSYISSYRFL